MSKRSAIEELFYSADGGRGRNTGYPVPPAQIPACTTNALGSSLEYERRSGDQVKDVLTVFSERNVL